MKSDSRSARPQPPYSPQALFQLGARVALVTGATGHLGEYITRALAAAGAHVIIVARSRSVVSDLAEDLKREGLQATAIACDVTKEAKLKRLVRSIEARFGSLDIIVNNAYGGSPGTISDATARDFSDAYRIAVEAAFRIVQLAHPLLIQGVSVKQGGASVINIASMYASVSPDPKVYGESGENNPPYYGAAKAGLVQLTRYLACHFAPERIRVNSISPGPFPADVSSESGRKFVNKLKSKVPLGRIGHPAELAGAVIFLASDASSYVTGVNIPVDGGWTAW